MTSMAKRKRSKKSASRVCSVERARIGKTKGKRAKGKALAAYMACRREHGIKPKRRRKSKIRR